MTLTLVIPAQNDADPLYQLLRQLGHLGIGDQIIVVDDASAPPLELSALQQASGLAGDQLLLLRQEVSHGAGAARNRALDHVTGSHLLFLDADDLPTAELPHLLRDLDGHVYDFCLFQHHDTRREKADGGWGQMPFDQALWQASGHHIGALGQVSPTAAQFLCRTANYPWNKIYRSDFLRQHRIRCTEIAVHNDIELHWRSFLAADRILASDRIAVVHHVAPQQGRLTNRTGPERLQVFQALTAVAREIGSQPQSPYGLPFARFCLTLTRWIDSIITPRLRPCLRQKTRSFLAREIPGPVLATARKLDTPPPGESSKTGTDSALKRKRSHNSPEVWLHIGLPKCGSSSLQHHLAEQAAQHRRLGVCYPDSLRTPDGYRNHLPLARTAATDLPRAVDRLLLEAEAQRSQRIVLSCEHWANVLPRGNLTALYKALCARIPAEKVKVVAYFRSPYDLVESGYAQYVHAGLFHISRHRFYRGSPPCIEKFLDHFAQHRGFPLYSLLGFAQQMQKAIPPQSLLLRSLEPGDLDSGDMLADFCALVGLPAPGARIPRSNTRISSRKLAELEYVQTLVDQERYAQLRPQLLAHSFGPAQPQQEARSHTLHIDATIAETIANQIGAEQADLAGLFSTPVRSLCALRDGDWSRKDLLSPQDRANLARFVAAPAV